jgi:HEAT repeat protein
MTRKRLIRIGFYGTTGFIFLLLLLDPYSRQSIFGPKVQDEPLCYWQGRIRRGAHPHQYQQSLVYKTLALLGVRPISDDAFPLEHGHELTVLLTLTDDGDPELRAVVARGLGFHRETAEATDALVHMLDDPASQVRTAAALACLSDGPSLAVAMPKFQQLMDDEVSLCRTSAAFLVSKASNPRDRNACRILLDGLQARDYETRILAIQGLCDVAKDLPDTFVVVRNAARQDPVTRYALACHAAKFGPTAVPFLAECLRESDSQVRGAAAWSLSQLGPDAKSAVPALVQRLADPSYYVQDAARIALSKIDPERYPEKKAEHQP